MNEFTALAYARVSTDDKEQTTESQIREIRRWCANNNITILEIYEEEKSAGDLNRSEFDRMMGRILRERIDFIVAWSETRLSRKTDDMTDIMRTLRKLGVKVRYVTSAIEPETSVGGLINYFNTWQGQEEREKLSINTKNGIMTAKLKGVHCGRPIALVFEHRYKENKSRIRLDGDTPTKVVSLESVLQYANLGYSTSKAAKAIGVGRNTLERELNKEGALEKYRDILESRPVWGKRMCPKGVVPKRGTSLNTSEEKTTSGEYAQKGTLLDNGEPLLNNSDTLLNSDDTLLGNQDDNNITGIELPRFSKERCLRCGGIFEVAYGKVNPCPECGDFILPCNACNLKVEGTQCTGENCPFDDEWVAEGS